MLCARHTVGSQGREGGLGNSQTPPDTSKHHSAVERGDNQGRSNQTCRGCGVAEGPGVHDLGLKAGKGVAVLENPRLAGGTSKRGVVGLADGW